METVNHPSHYQQGGMEVIDVIEAFTEDCSGIEAFCVGNIIKYVCRFKKKNGLEDLEKAEWYLGYLIEFEQKEKFLDDVAKSNGVERDGYGCKKQEESDAPLNKKSESSKPAKS